jgi:4-hydroxy-tetrahydrodipicolinate synthase
VRRRLHVRRDGALIIRRAVEPSRPTVVVALVTPFRDDGTVDLEVLAEHIEFLVTAGVDSLMPCGTTGEGPLLEDDETATIIAAVVERAGGRASVLAHVGRAATASTVALARRAIANGADAVSAVVPYYYALSDGQVVAHYRALLAAAGDIPALAYTIPERTGNNLSPDVAAALADEGLAGVKDSTKSFDRHREYLALARPGFAVYMGSDGMVLDALRAGAAGCVSALANVRPDLLVRLRDAVAAGWDDEAAALQAELSSLRQEARGPAGVKRSLAARVDGYPAALRGPLG